MAAQHAPKPPVIASVGVQEALGPEELRRHFSRTPRPYLLSHDAVEARQAPAASAASSASGTEADDERPHGVKALPPAALRPTKGLKTGETDEYALLTPSQLDERERKAYFPQEAAGDDGERREREEVLQRRFAEFVRRTCEVALMGVILAAVLCGKGVVRSAWDWRRELLSQVATIIALIAAYPLKLSLVDTHVARNKLWERFRVPASFDPATVLYPPLLPVLVALSVAPANPAVILPNIILGLASLPQRLFPRSSRLGGFNALHWLVAIIPLIVSQGTAWRSKTSPPAPYMLKNGPSLGLSPETLVSLYPLHHALLQPLHYLTTTSLLISELHLCSVALINLLLLASSPQSVIVKACLWIGGVSLFVSCGPVLHWNVTLARMPRWKLRRPGHTAEERKSLVDAVSDLINLQRAAGAFNSASKFFDSDADEDEPSTSIKHKSSKSTVYDIPKADTAGLAMPSLDKNIFNELQPAVEQGRLVRHLTQGALSNGTSAKPRPRRNTVPEREPPAAFPERQPSSRRKAVSTRLLWCLQLTPEQAQRRRWIYAGFTYFAMVTIILIPVKGYVAQKALHGQEPIGWALGYLFGQTSLFRSIVQTLDLELWITLPPSALQWNDIPLALPHHIDLVRSAWGMANVRLLLIGYWALVLLAGLLVVFSLTEYVEVDTRRKVFHGVMVAMLLPATFVDPCYCALALSLALAIFLLLEVIRAGQVPPLGNAIGRFLAPYVDGRDLRGPVVVSHIFLLIGCAVPLWFSLASVERAASAQPWNGWELADNARETAMVAGVICVGMGDAAASLIGRRYGRHKWIWVGGKSIEGSAAFAAAVTTGLIAIRAWEEFGGWNDATKYNYNYNYNNYNASGTERNALEVVLEWSLILLKAVFCACGASFMEAVLTGANDNVVVPVALWLLVKGVRL